MAAKKAKKKVQIFPIVNTIIMILFVIITLYPVLNTLAISLNDGTDSLRGGIYLLPRKFTWKNYGTSERQPDHRCLCYGCKNCDRNSSCADLQCNPSIYRQQKKIYV